MHYSCFELWTERIVETSISVVTSKPVSYTHLDVYKRQSQHRKVRQACHHSITRRCNIQEKISITGSLLSSIFMFINVLIRLCLLIFTFGFGSRHLSATNLKSLLTGSRLSLDELKKQDGYFEMTNNSLFPIKFILFILSHN